MTNEVKGHNFLESGSPAAAMQRDILKTTVLPRTRTEARLTKILTLVVKQTGSLLGVSPAHGIMALGEYQVMPGLV
ncbi:hypothetical protein M1N79_01265 [Dehalococcoidia bacterium]|nr:hypothetical protein [Dehalococcoidia bacterium]